MIFARRAMQKRLDELKTVLDAATVTSLVARLNRTGDAKLTAMWEVVLFHALSKCGALQTELTLLSGRRPDVFLNFEGLDITADITTVSDAGVEEQNPVDVLCQLIETAKGKLNLPIGGLDVRVRGTFKKKSKWSQLLLKLPDKQLLPKFVKDQVVPQLRQQIAAGEKILHLAFDDDHSGFEITIDPSKTKYNTAGYPTYNHPQNKTENALYRALKSKADQLKGAPGLVGIMVCDGNTQTLALKGRGERAVTTDIIVNEFFRQHSSVDFVFTVTVQTQQSAMWGSKDTLNLKSTVFVRSPGKVPEKVHSMLRALTADMPQPIRTPVNGMHSARASGYGLGYHGGYSRLSDKRIKISSRHLMELLAGKVSIEEMDQSYGWSSQDGTPSRRGRNPFSVWLSEGRLPTSIVVEKTDENGPDDWIEFKFNDTDPAITRFK